MAREAREYGLGEINQVLCGARVVRHPFSDAVHWTVGYGLLFIFSI